MTHDDETQGCRVRYADGRVALEAWAPGKAECVAQAVRGLVRDAVWPAAAVLCVEDVERIEPRSDQDLLARALKRAIVPLAQRGLAPADVQVVEESDGTVTLALVLVRNALLRRMPATVDPDDVVLERAGGGWHCHAVITARPLAPPDEGFTERGHRRGGSGIGTGG
ncbi:hypothetical protein MF672_001285 [Actinomadura sp. ATCC 31491]|uniref:Uncharacterized protein n=1 Tax=Actinomadura luzonensis TaxID=2805427 RepID=A0ABT0FJE8_9ACTN|nr:hypothetical protein [Actinomadura luzonensis]MCK2212438.1 hypothetical protein [Actinomadura luzonensis]